ncbi:hypothetical protein JZ751_029569 [Albula glossodonta]|uniref:Uncharacterized protein n=1 Tax=Albula glossodonta TaxID=121402 RepID=A0A8T2NA24_9TELE|nr:hypothetical protein JZ751_029569 [Albula glossodonta]
MTPSFIFSSVDDDFLTFAFKLQKYALCILRRHLHRHHVSVWGNCVLRSQKMPLTPIGASCAPPSPVFPAPSRDGHCGKGQSRLQSTFRKDHNGNQRSEGASYEPVLVMGRVEEAELVPVWESSPQPGELVCLLLHMRQ